MTIKSAVDHAIDLGSKHVSLSPAQYKNLVKITGDYWVRFRTYRHTKISIWKREKF